MNNFLEGTRLKLKFNTPYGVLSIEQLWDLSRPKLANLIQEIKKTMKADNGDDELSFLDETKTIDKVQELRFNIVKEIYLIKKEEETAEKNAASIKDHNEKIMAKIFKKQEEELDEKSIDELKALLK